MQEMCWPEGCWEFEVGLVIVMLLKGAWRAPRDWDCPAPSHWGLRQFSERGPHASESCPDEHVCHTILCVPVQNDQVVRKFFKEWD